MRISFNTRLRDINTISGINGYGYATNMVLDSLKRLGYEVTVNDSTADVGLVFDMAEHAKWFGDQYKIVFCPWESSKLPDSWVGPMNHADEVWTPSPVIADWYKNHNPVTTPIFVYEHGVEHSWAPKLRERKDKIRFLTVGVETRKRAWNIMEIFRQTFVGIDDVELTIKSVDSPWNKFTRLGKINFIDARMPLKELQELHYEHDAFVYNSSGEGFGFAPLQALATGMPTITPTAWAPYKRFVEPELAVDCKLDASPWPKIHPGDVFHPSRESLSSSLLEVYNNFDVHAKVSYEQASQIHKEYDWDLLTSEVFKALESRINLQK